ncbi:MAG: HEAT repeat domain-containing protein [Candidatus Sulfotelmatobacter sp.]
MDVSQTFSSGAGTSANTNVAVDPRLQPTPDYGTLGPGSDVAGLGSSPNPISVRKPAPPLLHLAIAIGISAALLAGTIRSVGPAWSGFQTLFSSQPRHPATTDDLRQLDHMKPQKQAETLLELAVGNTAGAVDQISSRVDRWQGKVQWNSQIANLSTAALNSTDMRVRQSGVEVELAAYGLAKNSASLDYLLKTANSPTHAQKIWALWALGLMGNRGVQPDRVVEALTSHLADSDADSRHWAVEGLALTGSDQTIQPLLQSMHDDPSPMVRERAACSLAQSGMFTQQQRLTAVPQLLNYIDDPSLDSQTHAWAFQALNDITHQRLPNDSAAWRNWYQSTKND